MESITVKVSGMSCQHCVKSVTNAVSALPGVSNVNVDLETGNVEVEADLSKTLSEEIKNAIEDQGYDVVS